MENIEHLVQQAQTGDPEAFTMLVTGFQNMAYGYAFSILGDFDLAQDAAQEAFIEAYQSLPALREPLAFSAWLKRIIYKQCDRLWRRKRHEIVPLETIMETDSHLPGLQEIVERNEFSSQVQKAIYTIPANLRTATILFYIGEYSQQEIADFLEVPVKTIKSRLYASRQRLKERMVAMVQNEFEQNPLPERFTRETVEQAILRAAELNKDRHFDEAEKLLRSLLDRVPEHPAVLKELNRAIMQGRVYGQGRWDLLSELATLGKLILKTSDDEEIHRQVAKTLLAIPAMPDAISFIESWIGEKGPSLDRLGMLSWAKGCSGDFAGSEALWKDLISLALSLPMEQAQAHVPFIAYTLVNCLSAACELVRAQAIAKQAWELCGGCGPLPPQETFTGDSDWLSIWHMAKLNMDGIGPTLLARHPENKDGVEQAIRLSIRGWLDDPGAVTAAWLSWAQTCAASGNYALLEKCRLVSLSGLRMRGLWQEANQLAGSIWQLLGNYPTSEAEQARARWDWERFNPVGAIEACNWLEAHKIVQAEIAARGVQGAVGWAAIVAGGSGSSTLPEILRALEENGVSKVDEYGMFGWYLLARESARAGDLPKAFDALRKALAYWSNTPYWITDLWEKDAYWGSLRDHPEFRQAFDDRRQRIGTINGQLHYFPGW